jgi:peptide/nickel transport system permease protein
LFGLAVLAVVVALSILAPVIAPYGPNEIDRSITDPNYVAHGFAPPSEAHWLGTDELNRDMLSRVLWAGRISLAVGFLSVSIGALIGIAIGATAGFSGGWVDTLLMRMTDLFLVVPALAVLLVAAKYLGHGSAFRIAFILGFLLWTNIARIVRGSFLSLKEKEYVEAAKASGSGDFRIMFRHILPNTIGPIVVAATLLTGTAILTESVISFLGFGISVPQASLGSLIADGEAAGLSLWWLVTFPGLTIVIIILCINFIGDGLRDALDPTQRRVRA